MLDVGRLCIKIAGRDAGKTVVIIDVLDSNYVMIDGESRRKKCNIAHLEPLKETIKIKKNESHSTIEKEFTKLNLKPRTTKPKKAKDKPKKVRKVKVKPVKKVKKVKEKKEKPKKEKAVKK